jgi:hypothetical protein
MVRFESEVPVGGDTMVAGGGETVSIGDGVMSVGDGVMSVGDGVMSVGDSCDKSIGGGINVGGSAEFCTITASSFFSVSICLVFAGADRERDTGTAAKIESKVLGLEGAEAIGSETGIAG